MTKVALINPGISSRFAVQEPLNLGYIAAYLEKNGIDVRVFDQLGGDDVRSCIDAFKPDVAGITSTTPVIYEAYGIADYCRSKGIKTVLGGVHPWIFPEEALKHCDIVVRGEGEKVMLDIVSGKAAGPVIDAGYIQNIEDLPSPARHLMKMDRYLYCKKYSPFILHLPYVPADKKIVHILTSRGCPHSECIFCHNTFKKFPYRANSAEKVIGEIKQLVKDYGIEAVYFVEDDFWADIGRVISISELMIKENLDHIVWGGSARVDQLVASDQKVLELAHRAGCRSLSIGFESGSPRILEVLKKGFTLEDAKAAIAKVRKAGIIAHGNIIVGTPTETIEDVNLSKKFIRETDLLYPEVYIFTPYPGNPIWCRLLDENKVSKDFDWRQFTQEESIINLSEIPTSMLNRLRAEMYILYYLTHPKYALEFIFNTLRHPIATLDKVYHTLLPVFRGKGKK
ncbi:MAG: radical SAM protein [Elusimicrobiota bacterium]